MSAKAAPRLPVALQLPQSKGSTILRSHSHRVRKGMKHGPASLNRPGRRSASAAPLGTSQLCGMTICPSLRRYSRSKKSQCSDHGATALGEGEEGLTCLIEQALEALSLGSAFGYKPAVGRVLPGLQLELFLCLLHGPQWQRLMIRHLLRPNPSNDFCKPVMH